MLERLKVHYGWFLIAFMIMMIVSLGLGHTFWHNEGLRVFFNTNARTLRKIISLLGTFISGTLILLIALLTRKPKEEKINE